MSQVGVIFPNQDGRGARTSTCPAPAVPKHAPHREAAIRFLEYLASDEAQHYFANGNNEWPAVAGVKVDNRGAHRAGRVQAGYAERGRLGRNQPVAQKIYRSRGLEMTGGTTTPGALPWPSPAKAG